MTGTAAARDGQRVVAVTGGGGGIGAAIAAQLGREGAFVVTLDPLVSLDGTEPLPTPEATTADRIVAAGGQARASSVSVTDGEAVRRLFADLVDELGRLDAVVNVAGISRRTSFAKGREEDWLAVLDVHLGGYLNVLAAALPIMSAAGHGRVLGVTSGSGWRPADAGAYGCAKRAVASLTWQLGRQAPPGVVVNAISPIAVTRMVTAALGGAGEARGTGSRSSSTGGLSLGSMPAPDDLGPLGAHLVGDGIAWSRGRVVFAGGSEVALIDEPRLLEVVRTTDVTALDHVLGAFAPTALAAAEAHQATSGGSNPRFAALFDEPITGDAPSAAAPSCAIVAEAGEMSAALEVALRARGASVTTIPLAEVGAGFGGAADALASTVARVGPLDAVVVALPGAPSASGSRHGWERVLAEHDGIVAQIHADAGWARAVADHAVGADRPVRLVMLTDATTAGGRSRAQASAQLARAGRGATGERVPAFAISMEEPGDGARPIGGVVAHLVGSPDAPALSGAELVVGAGWFGLRSHPRPIASITFGGPEIPDWFDGTCRAIVGAPEETP